MRKRVFICSPLRGTPSQLEAIEREVVRYADDLRSAPDYKEESVLAAILEKRRRLRAQLQIANEERAEALCLEASLAGVAPFASHLFCTRFLRDEVPAERHAGIDIGGAFLAVCDELWADVRDGVSSGMEAEIAAAHSLNIEVKEKWRASDASAT